MKDGKITVIPQNMKPYEISIRDADAENDLFCAAFETACKADTPEGTEQAMFAWDFFKYGWEAAVNALKDDPVGTKPYFDWEKYESELAAKTLQSEPSEEAKAFYSSIKKL